MDENLKNIIRRYKDNDKRQKRLFALSKWKELKQKPYPIQDIFLCIYEKAGGNFKVIDEIIDKLTAKRKVQGRTQVYASDKNDVIDIVSNGDGKLVLQGYNAFNPLPLKGQHNTRNGKIFRKSDGQTNKNFQKTEEKAFDLGQEMRNMFPKEDKQYIYMAMKSVRNYSLQHKISIDKVISSLKKGRLVIDDEIWRIRPNIRESINKTHTIVITESIAENIANEMEMTEYKFNSNIKYFISQLLQDPVNAQPPAIFKFNGLKRSVLLAKMIKFGLITRIEKISDKDENGQPKRATMLIKFKCPKKNFTKKLKKLYISLFEKNLPNKQINEEDGCAGGATSASSSGAFIQPAFPIQRRKLPTEIEETATSNTVGNYEYDVPFAGDDESLSRKNGICGSVSINNA